MSIKDGFHYDDYNDCFYLDEQGEKIEEGVCLCYAHEPSECSCDCTSWDLSMYNEDDYDEYKDQLDWQKHQEETRGDKFDE